MAKGIGLIGNFKGKVGNMVGYHLKDSNNKQTQGVRVYQPIVKNPKTSAQAEQRAKLAPINGTYRALKLIIDRGIESQPYGNKSRLAWLKKAFKALGMPWFVKGSTITSPVLCEISRGSLPSIFKPDTEDGRIKLPVAGLVGSETTLGAVCSKILAAYPQLKAGDQLTAVSLVSLNGSIQAYVGSIVLDSDSTAVLPANIVVEEGLIDFAGPEEDAAAGCLIVSREGSDGEHLRSTESLVQMAGYNKDLYAPAAKTAAIESYMSSAASNSDWAEESIQG